MKRKEGLTMERVISREQAFSFLKFSNNHRLFLWIQVGIDIYSNYGFYLEIRMCILISSLLLHPR